jgi:alpha-beta hydrolase superfamily lysophospholipase
MARGRKTGGRQKGSRNRAAPNWMVRTDLPIGSGKRLEALRWIIFDNQKIGGALGPYRFLHNFAKPPGHPAVMEFLKGRADNALAASWWLGTCGPAATWHGETGDMWVPLAEDLARERTVVVPDLRGMGLSAKPASGYDKKTQANDVAGILDALKIERAALITHDIGNMVGYAFAAQYRHRVTRFVVIDAPLPGVGPWEEILKNPPLWHFRAPH